MRQPLAERIRPSELDAYFGQAHLVGDGMPLSQVVKTGRVPSMILWGPPGVGKTTLARLIARHTGREFFEISAVSAGKDELRAIVEKARPKQESTGLFSGNEPEAAKQAPVLFLDEIHRFNKAQQDFLLPYVENGTIVLIGATTENPSFEVISALLSRCQVFVLEPLGADELRSILLRGAKELGADLDSAAADFLLAYAAGDARQALNLLENAAALYDGEITVDNLKKALQAKTLRYDKKDEEHYNTISAFIKSMRASKPDAALYYLARMIEGGEDPKLIARRIVIFASEDIGMADPQALQVANAVFRAVEIIGYPECSINLGHGAVYMSLAPKSRAAYDGIMGALGEVKKSGPLPIPKKLRNAPTKLMKELGYGQAYEMYDSASYLPDALEGKHFFVPSSDVGSSE